MTQYGASPHTVASYRDTFKLLLGYIPSSTGKLPARLTSPTWTPPRSEAS